MTYETQDQNRWDVGKLFMLVCWSTSVERYSYTWAGIPKAETDERSGEAISWVVASFNRDSFSEVQPSFNVNAILPDVMLRNTTIEQFWEPRLNLFSEPIGFSFITEAPGSLLAFVGIGKPLASFSLYSL